MGMNSNRQRNVLIRVYKHAQIMYSIATLLLKNQRENAYVTLTLRLVHNHFVHFVCLFLNFIVSFLFIALMCERHSTGEQNVVYSSC